MQVTIQYKCLFRYFQVTNLTDWPGYTFYLFLIHWPTTSLCSWIWVALLVYWLNLEFEMGGALFEPTTYWIDWIPNDLITKFLIHYYCCSFWGNRPGIPKTCLYSSDVTPCLWSHENQLCWDNVSSWNPSWKRRILYKPIPSISFSRSCICFHCKFRSLLQYSSA